MYHRIARPPVDPWGLAVRPQHFQEHLDVIRRSRRPFFMSEFVGRLERRALPGNAVAITFDDGYVDNLREASPRLQAADVPATLFLATGPAGQEFEYWWDELARAILCRSAALECDVDLAGKPYRLALPADEAPAPRTRAWRAWDEPRTAHEAAYLALWRRVRDLASHQRDAVMKGLRGTLGVPAPDPADLPMTEREVAELAAGGLFEIGGHTVTHPVLPALPPAGRRREILEGKRTCERIAQRPVAGFAYPHGALDADCRAAVRECGFSWACSTEERAVPERQYDLFALPRVGVLDWDGGAFERALRTADERADG